jgi:hypothetical protein
MSKSNITPIDHSCSGVFENRSYLTIGRNGDSSNTTVLELFELYTSPVDSVRLYFDAHNQLVLTYSDSLVARTVLFKGQFRKRGYYEIFIRNYKVEIPPFFPIIYGQRDIKRLRVGLNKDLDLVIDNKWARTGNIFILAGGGSDRDQSCFKQIALRH